MASMQGEGSDSTDKIQEGTSIHAASDESCNTCPFAFRGFQKLCEEGILTMPYGVMKESAERGHCKVCTGIVKFISTRKLEPDGVCFTSHRSGGVAPVLSGLREGRGWSDGYELFVEGNHPAGEEGTAAGLCLGAVEIPRLRMPSGDTSGEAAFGTLKRWISRCQEEHKLCQRPADKALPRRLLEIKSIEPLRIRLVEDADRREGYGDYACLSHRWGPNTESNSLKGWNINTYQAGVPESKFDPLVKDAIVAIFRLGLRLVWIDYFCIIQDSQQDWEVEASSMADIYENAFLTIAATSTQENCGMFSTLPREFEAFQVTEMRGEPIYIRKQFPHPCENVWWGTREEARGALLERGWVFQERLLSNRFIHFTSSEIFWECRESTWCECDSGGPMWAEQRMNETRTIHDQDWKSIMDQYDITQLSLEKDRLPALAGVARRYAELLGGWTYLSGLWKEDLPCALAWHKSVRNRPRPLVQAAPTWSWASLPRGKIVLTKSFRGHMPLIEHNINPPGADVYAGGRSAEITIEGPTLDLEVYVAPMGRLVGKHQNALFMIEADFKPDPDDDTNFRAVANGSSCLLLLLVDPSEKSTGVDVHGIVLMQQNGGVDVDGKDAKFERIGSLVYYGAVYVDNFNDCAEQYRGGRFPPFANSDDGRWTETRNTWLLSRAKNRRVTLV